MTGQANIFLQIISIIFNGYRTVLGEQYSGKQGGVEWDSIHLNPFKLTYSMIMLNSTMWQGT